MLFTYIVTFIQLTDYTKILKFSHLVNLKAESVIV